MKKASRIILSLLLAALLAACAGTGGSEPVAAETPVQEETGSETEAPPEQDEQAPEDQGEEDDFRIGIVTGSFSQSEDDRRGAEAFQRKYGDDHVTLAIYPDNFIDESETTVGVITGLADDPKMKAIIVNQAVEGTDEAFRRIKEKRPDILCIAGETFDVFDDMSKVADLVVNNDFVTPLSISPSPGIFRMKPMPDE